MQYNEDMTCLQEQLRVQLPSIGTVIDLCHNLMPEEK